MLEDFVRADRKVTSFEEMGRTIRQACMRRSIVRLQGERTQEHLSRKPQHPLGMSAVKVTPPHEIEAISIDVFRQVSTGPGP